MVAVPQHTTLRETYLLLAFYQRALCHIRLVQREDNLLGRDDAHAHRGFLLQPHCIFLTLTVFSLFLDQCHYFSRFLFREADFFQYGNGLLCRDFLEVFFSRGDDKPGHIECSRRHHHLLIAFGSIAVRTVFLAQEDHGEEVFMVAPAQDVHHGFLSLRFALGFHCLIDFPEHFLVALTAAALDKQGRCRIVANKIDAFVLVELEHLFKITAQPLPLLLQGHYPASSRLEMKMVGSRGTTLRTVIENHQVGPDAQQLMDFSIMIPNGLRLVCLPWDGIVGGKYRIRIHQQFVLVVDRLLHLLLWTVLGTEEAGALGQCLAVNLRSGGNHSGGIKLCLQGGLAYRKVAGLHLMKVAEMQAGQFPCLQLPVEETRPTAIVGQIALAAHHPLAGTDFHRAQPVLIKVVGIHLLHREGGIAVASPTAAQIEFAEYPAYAIATAESQSQRIVFSIGCIGEFYLTEQRREEGTRCSESVDAKGIVRSVLVGPFGMADKSRRQCVQVEVAHPVTAHNHGRLLLIECIHHLLQGAFRRIEVV